MGTYSSLWVKMKWKSACLHWLRIRNPEKLKKKILAGPRSVNKDLFYRKVPTRNPLWILLVQDRSLNLYRKLTGPTSKSVSQASTQSPPLSPTKVRKKVSSPPLCESFYFKIGLWTCTGSWRAPRVRACPRPPRRALPSVRLKWGEKSPLLLLLLLPSGQNVRGRKITNQTPAAAASQTRKKMKRWVPYLSITGCRPPSPTPASFTREKAVEIIWTRKLKYPLLPSGIGEQCSQTI